MLAPERVWVEDVDPEVAANLAQELNISPILARLLLRRGIEDGHHADAFLSHGVEAGHDPLAMRDMGKAVDILRQAIADGHSIFIHGDYDVDGICSTVLLVEGLRELKAEVSYHLPDRFTEGYGVSLAAVEKAAAEGHKVLLTVDCGSSSVREVAAAQAAGMQVIIADHHHIPENAPQPEAFLNPQLQDCSYPFKPLCGTGVAFKLIQALSEKLPEHFLDLVCLATIADVVPLVGENRALVRSGLQRLARFERPGVRALAEIAGAYGQRLGAWAVAFGLGPRLNAAGRLEHAGLGAELLLCRQLDKARPMAEELEKLNQKRRDIEGRMRDEIVARLEEEPEKVELGVVVEAGESWHQGVIGITASRIVDRYAVPALVMSIEGEYAKGSARSPENVDLYAAMCRVKDVFVKFGGHPRAAGFTIKTDRIDELRERIAPVIEELRQGPAPVRVDMTLSLDEATLELSRELEKLEPIGEANPRPMFLAKGVSLERVRAVGKTKDHLQIHMLQGGVRKKAIAFRQADDLPHLSTRELFYDVLYHIQEETWEGRTEASLVVEAILAPEVQVNTILDEVGGAFPMLVAERPELWDLRNVRNRRRGLERILNASANPLVVASGENQATKLSRSLERPVATLAQLPAEPVDDLVLLAPPSSLDWFKQSAITESLRVHFLFGHRELQMEEARQAHLWLDRPRMVGIWRSLMQHARSGPIPESALPRIAKALPAAPETVQVAVGVLEELGVASWEIAERERLLRLGKGRGASLEESGRFRELAARRQQFLKVRELLGARHLRLSEEVRGAS